MGTSYKDIVGQLRTAFPAPVSDRVHDAYFVFSFLRALDQVDALKSAAPMLGTPVTLDYDAARRQRMAEILAGRYTLETSRAGSGPLAALANLRLFGRRGLQALLGQLVAMPEELREQLDGHTATTVLNGANFGPVTLFRVYPDGVDTFSMPDLERHDPAYRDRLRAHNTYNRRLFELIQADALQGQGIVISMTDCYRETAYGEPIVALKSYILSPFSEDQHVEAVLESIWKARRLLAQ